jgi:hypothetical protein
MRGRIDAIYKLVEQVRSKAQEAMAERRRMPVLEEKQFAQLCQRVDARYEPHERDFVIKVVLTAYLNGSSSLAGKLEQIAGLITEDVTNEQVAHLDDIIADLLGAGSLVQDILGAQPNLGAALGVLADLIMGRFDITKVSKPTPQLALVHSLIAGRGMPASKAVLLDRLRRELASPKPLCRAPNPAIEKEELNKLDAKLKDGNGNYLLGKDFEEMVSKRSQAIRRVTLERLGIAT